VFELDDLEELAALFARLGAPRPERWARTQLLEGTPELARFVFLRQAWRRLLAEGDTSWIEPTIAAARAAPDAPFAGVGHALARLRESGARDEDVAEVARGMQAAALFALAALLDGPRPGELEPEIADLRWAMVQLGERGEPEARIGALADAVLETDPSGRETRPE